MRKLAVANQKGGVGKSTLTVHLAYAAIEEGLRVLLVDLDRQGSLSLSFPPASAEASGLKASALFSGQAVEGEPEMISEKVGIIRADDALSLLDGGMADAAMRPKRNLARFADRFDLCLIDTPGAIGFNPPMTVAALIAADAVVCPFGVGLYEAKGLADLWTYLTSIKTPAYNPSLRLLGLVPSRFNAKSKEEMEALADLRGKFKTMMLPGELVERQAVKQAIARRRPVWKNTRGAGHLKAAREYYAVCNHILGLLRDVR